MKARGNCWIEGGVDESQNYTRMADVLPERGWHGMRHLYKVQFGVKWKAEGKRSYWDDENFMNVVANGDAMVAVQKVERKAKSLTMDDSALEGGAFWRASAFRLISVNQSVEVTS